MALSVIPYNRAIAVAYAHQWAYRRNPAYYNYEEIGGDCTNFASQCLYAGTGIMNYTPTFGWYYIDANNKAPAWTGVEYFHNFIVRDKVTPGPYGISTTLEQMEPGDFVQFRFNQVSFGHTPIIVSIGDPPTLDNTLVAAHSYDADWRPLSSYYVKEIRYLHILGAYRSEIENEPEQKPDFPTEEESIPSVPPSWWIPPLEDHRICQTDKIWQIRWLFSKIRSA